MNFNQKKGHSFVLWFHRVFFMHQCPKFFSDAHQAILNPKGEKNDLEILAPFYQDFRSIVLL